MDAVQRVAAVREVLRAAGVGPDRALVRSWWGGVSVDLRDDGAEHVGRALTVAGWPAVVVGERVVMIWHPVD